MRELKAPFQLRKPMNAMMCYPLPLFLIFYRSGGKSSTRKPSGIGILKTTSRHIKLTSCLWYRSYTTLTFSLSI